MSLTPEQSFKIGFLQACAEMGFTLDETHQRVKQAIALKRSGYQMEKQAWWPWLAGGLSYLGGKAVGAIPALASLGLTTAGVVGIGAPVAAGALTGYGAAKLKDLDNDDKGTVEDAKNEEIVGEYQRLAEEAKRRTALKKLQQEGRHVVALTPPR